MNPASKHLFGLIDRLGRDKKHRAMTRALLRKLTGVDEGELWERWCDRAEKLDDAYVRDLLRKGTALTGQDIPDELVKLKRAELKLKRRLWNKTNHQKA